MALWRGALAAILMTATAGFSSAQAAQMKVPFNFQWGESQARVERSLEGIKARIVDRQTNGSRTNLVVEGIPQKQLRRTVFHFRDDMLEEIELQFGDSSWDTIQYERSFDEVRRNVDSKYGMGRLLTRTRTREQDVMQTLSGYQWTQNSMALRLFLFVAEKDAETHRVLSLHYRQI